MPRPGNCRPLKSRIIESRKIDKSTGCWVWIKRLNSTGYGALTCGSRVDNTRRIGLAHRISYEIFVGAIPDGLFVCHKCDNRKCFNPKHLFLGTALDNTRDCIAKGRYNFKHGWTGEAHPAAKLTVSDIRDIRRSSEDANFLAKSYNINPAHVRSIWAGRSWKSVPFEPGFQKRARRKGRAPKKIGSASRK